MSRSSAARTAERYLNLKPISRLKLGECPVCEEPVFADEKAKWMMHEDSPTRVHEGCVGEDLGYTAPERLGGPTMKYEVKFTDNQKHVAVCECGWKSDPMMNAGLAGAAFDAHVEKDHD